MKKISGKCVNKARFILYEFTIPTYWLSKDKFLILNKDMKKNRVTFTETKSNPEIPE